MAKMKREALALLGQEWEQAGDRAGLEASFDRALQTLWMAFQPIVDARTKGLYGYEALLRSGEPTLPHPGAVIQAAERLGRLDELGRAIRAHSAAQMQNAPPDAVLFVNLHTRDLLDESLMSPESPLTAIASRVILEITERASLDVVKDIRPRVARLREMGFRIAIDDLGAGYAGLTSFALLEPDIVKLDMSLVRDIHKNPMKRKVVRSMTSLCNEMGLLVVGEGIEVVEERDTLLELGCQLLQGYLLAKPGKPFPEFKW
jgi:EAL domain-containing protein (putative c-di-GMP-specific phosphodiesterase class I)